MISAYYDLHIHSALSPCADDDMTPCNIVGMAILGGLDVIAVTDHNSFANAKATVDAAIAMHSLEGHENNLIVLPGAEITTSEEVHVVCLFESIKRALSFEEELSAFFVSLKNREDIFGRQLLFDFQDNEQGTVERMLIAPTTISFDSLFELVKKYEGAFVPAHIDRSSFSVISNLGFLPPDLDIAAVELTSRSDPDDAAGNRDFSRDEKEYPGKKIVYSSDAHQLHVINGKKHYMDLPELSAKAVIEYLSLMG